MPIIDAIDAWRQLARELLSDDDIEGALSRTLAHADGAGWITLFTADRKATRELDDALTDAMTWAARKRRVHDGVAIAIRTLSMCDLDAGADVMARADWYRTQCQAGDCVLAGCAPERCCAKCACDGFSCGCDDGCQCLRCDATAYYLTDGIQEYVRGDMTRMAAVIAMCRRFGQGDYGLAGIQELEDNADTLRDGFGTLTGRYSGGDDVPEIWVGRDIDGDDAGYPVAMLPIER